MARNHERRLACLAGAVLLLAVLSLAAVRQQGYGLTFSRDGDTQLATVGLSPSEAHPWFDATMAVWEARCAGCHAELDYIPALFAAEGGRGYLVDLMLFGARGEAVIHGELQSFRHRPFADQFGDQEMADLLNLMLLAWGNDQAMPAEAELYSAEEIAAARTRAIPQEEVLQGRPEVTE